MTKITLDDFYQPQPSTHPAVRVQHIVNETRHKRLAECESAPEFNPDLLTLALYLATAYGRYDLLLKICDEALHMPPSVAVAYIEGRLVSFVVPRVLDIVSAVKQRMECDTSASQKKGKLERFGDIPRE